MINDPNDLKNLEEKSFEQLAAEIREFLIENISKTGGHIASNLGVVELTLALHRVFDTNVDKIVWDVGHQTYVHKMLTGRKDGFCSLRMENGISGFPKVTESCHDCFNTGHSSTSISAALGMAKARDLNKEKHSVVCVIGDGALTGGMAFEALNDAGQQTTDLIVVLNDNQMSIAKNVGGLSRYFSKLRTKPAYYHLKSRLEGFLNKNKAGKYIAKKISRLKSKIKYIITPGILFEELGFTYLGPIDGHKTHQLTEVLNSAKKMKGPIMIHVFTKKGKGYKYAEEFPDEYHGISPFEVETGKVVEQSKLSYSAVFGHSLLNIAHGNRKAVAITAAMVNGTGLKNFSKIYPERFFDVGIAEQHALTFAAGLACGSIIPVVAIYSTFLQRAYDQILHDVALQDLHVIIGVDRAGITGEDGETHQGIYDISFLRHMPNITFMAPGDLKELEYMLNFAVNINKGPSAIRYPKGSGPSDISDILKINGDLCRYYKIEKGRGKLIKEGRDVTVVALGSMLETAVKANTILLENGIDAEIINPRFIKPLDFDLIKKSVEKTGLLVTLEDGIMQGGFGSAVMEQMHENMVNVKSRIFALPDEPVPHGSRSSLLKNYGLSENSLAEKIVDFVKSSSGGVR